MSNEHTENEARIGGSGLNAGLGTAKFIYCPQCKNSTIIETDYEDENGEEDTQGRRCEECGWEGDISELVCA